MMNYTEVFIRKIEEMPKNRLALFSKDYATTMTWWQSITTGNTCDDREKHSDRARRDAQLLLSKLYLNEQQCLYTLTAFQVLELLYHDSIRKTIVVRCHALGIAI